MTMQDTLTKEFGELIKEGQSILHSCGWNGEKFSRWPNDTDYLRFRTRALNLVQQVCGDGSEHHRELRRLAESKDSTTNSSYLPHCLGVVEAAQQDYEQGLLFSLRALIEAELLGDFIDQAEMLVSQGYYVPAASLAGAVLEDFLRKLCVVHGIPIPTKTNINSLNIALAKKGVYNALVQKLITGYADIRNNADHGHSNQFKPKDVEDMIQYLRRFTVDYLH